MLSFNIMCSTKRERDALMNRMREALKGCGALESKEIDIFNFVDYDTAFTIALGHPNDSDVDYDIPSIYIGER